MENSNIQSELVRLVDLIGEQNIQGRIASICYSTFLHFFKQRQAHELMFLIVAGTCRLKVYGKRELKVGMLVALESTTRICLVGELHIKKCIILLRDRNEINYFQKGIDITIKKEAFVSNLVMVYSDQILEKGESLNFFKLPHLGDKEYKETDEAFIVGGDGIDD